MGAEIVLHPATVSKRVKQTDSRPVAVIDAAGALGPIKGAVLVILAAAQTKGLGYPEALGAMGVIEAGLREPIKDLGAILQDLSGQGPIFPGIGEAVTALGRGHKAMTTARSKLSTDAPGLGPEKAAAKLRAVAERLTGAVDNLSRALKTLSE